MPSCPAEERYRDLVGAWDRAFEALARGEADRAAALVDEAQRSLDELAGSAIPDGHRAALEASFGRLAGACRDALDETRATLRRTRQARRALAGYRDPAAGRGGRRDSRA